MTPKSLRIAIVGCGTAGPAAAVLLSRLGHEVVLFERADECKAVGAGFLLQPSGMEVLEELGILDAVLAHAAKVDFLHVLDADGKTLLDLPTRHPLAHPVVSIGPRMAHARAAGVLRRFSADPVGEVSHDRVAGGAGGLAALVKGSLMDSQSAAGPKVFPDAGKVFLVRSGGVAHTSAPRKRNG